MNRDEVRELAALYAVGGLDGEDRARFEALLRSRDPDAVAALGDFESTLLGIAAESSESPPPRVRAALMDRVAAEGRGEPARVPVRPVRRRRVLWPAVWAAAMAAGIAAIAVGLVVSMSYEQRLDALAREAAALKSDIARRQQLLAMLRDPATQIVGLAGLAPAPAARARMIWKSPEGGFLIAAGLPPAPAGKTYQLWAIAGQNPPVSAGVFTVDARGAGSLRVPPLPGVEKVDVFAVTLEPAGGLPAPSGPMYLASKSA
jgi:anti-sigma-K factor RskA